jgi:hypothetical protein
MLEPPPELTRTLGGLVRRIMQETDQKTYDDLAEQIWRILEEIEQRRNQAFVSKQVA